MIPPSLPPRTGRNGRPVLSLRMSAPTMREAKRLLKAVKRDPEAFDAPLMP